jgi:hypothetical protein
LGGKRVEEIKNILSFVSDGAVMGLGAAVELEGAN